MIEPTSDELRSAADTLEAFAQSLNLSPPNWVKLLRSKATELDKEPVVLVINTSGWTRMREVNEYARSRSVSLETAVNELINSGLSHWSDR